MVYIPLLAYPMSICDFVITNGSRLGELCGRKNCQQHLYHSRIDNDDSQYCPIIISTGKNKGRMCCKRLHNGGNKCFIHRKKRLPIRNINYRKCCHIHNFIGLLDNPIHLSFSNFRFCQQTLTCNIHTRNRNGLCNFHHHLVSCPCPKHKHTIINYEPKQPTPLTDLLYMEDIYSIISKYLMTHTIKLIRCVDTQLSTKSLVINSNPFTNNNSQVEIIQYIRHHLNQIVQPELTKMEKKTLATNMFDYLVNNKKFVFNNPKFAITVYNKLLELKNQMDNIDYYIQNIFYQ